MGCHKRVSKYELRKFELNRQKKLLALKKDEKSKQRLKDSRGLLRQTIMTLPMF